MRPLKWLKNLMVGQRLRLKVDKFSRELSKLETLCKASHRELKTRSKELEVIRAALDESEVRLRETVEEARNIHKRYEDQLSAVRVQLKIAEEVTVPTLMEQNNRFLQMWKAQTAIEVARQVKFQPVPGQDES